MSITPLARDAVAAVALVLLAPVLGACGDDSASVKHDAAADGDAGHDEEGPVGIASGATCPDDAGSLTYDDFGKPFVESYCVRCHASELTGDARRGAPLGHDFDSLEGILLVADHIDQLAAAGPDHVNETMPPNGDKPSLHEREQLGQWLDCELR